MINHSAFLMPKIERKMIMKLEDTIEMMKSEDYKDRFIAEYRQLVIRMYSLQNMLEKYEDGTLPFEPKCSYKLLMAQLAYMDTYKKTLEERAEIEGIV